MIAHEKSWVSWKAMRYQSASDELSNNKACVVASRIRGSAPHDARQNAPHSQMLIYRLERKGWREAAAQRRIVGEANGRNCSSRMFGVGVVKFAGDRDVGDSKGWQLVVQWKRGHDVQAFEGIASRVGRKMREATDGSSKVGWVTAELNCHVQTTFLSSSLITYCLFPSTNRSTVSDVNVTVSKN